MKTWTLVNLDAATRPHMVTEFESDLQDGTLYRSRSFSEYGRTQYPEIMHDALILGNPNSFIKQLLPIFFNEFQSNGHHLNKSDAARKFGGGQFNLFYIRGLCIRAKNGGIVELKIYRAKPSSEHRPESDAMVGEMRNASALLDDLRSHKNSQPSLGFPPGAHSGLSVRLP